MLCMFFSSVTSYSLARLCGFVSGYSSCQFSTHPAICIFITTKASVHFKILPWNLMFSFLDRDFS